MTNYILFMCALILKEKGWELSDIVILDDESFIGIVTIDYETFAVVVNGTVYVKLPITYEVSALLDKYTPW